MDSNLPPIGPGSRDEGSMLKDQATNISQRFWGGRHSSVVSSAPTILRPQVRIPSTPSLLFSICIIGIGPFF